MAPRKVNSFTESWWEKTKNGAWAESQNQPRFAFQVATYSFQGWCSWVKTHRHTYSSSLMLSHVQIESGSCSWLVSFHDHDHWWSLCISKFGRKKDSPRNLVPRCVKIPSDRCGKHPAGVGTIATLSSKPRRSSAPVIRMTAGCLGNGISSLTWTWWCANGWKKAERNWEKAGKPPACWAVKPELAGYNLSWAVREARSATWNCYDMDWHVFFGGKQISCRMKPPLMMAPSQPWGLQAKSIASATRQPKAFSRLRSSWVLVESGEPMVHNTSSTGWCCPGFVWSFFDLLKSWHIRCFVTCMNNVINTMHNNVTVAWIALCGTEMLRCNIEIWKHNKHSPVNCLSTTWTVRWRHLDPPYRQRSSSPSIFHRAKIPDTAPSATSRAVLRNWYEWSTSRTPSEREK